jgi:hypothetical protein
MQGLEIHWQSDEHGYALWHVRPIGNLCDKDKNGLLFGD